MRLPQSIFLVLGAFAGGFTGYGLGTAEVTPGTYYVDIDRAVNGVPIFEEMKVLRMGPVQKAGDDWTARKAKFDEDAARFALLEEGSSEYRDMQVSLAIREENLKAEFQLLTDAANQVNEGLAYEAQKIIQNAVEVLANEKGYEQIVLSPLTNSVIPWENPAAARDLLRNRTTIWIHPDRDITTEVGEILNR
ncbi:MAG: hypothetical protein MK209_03410 [Planctomycetes bacterium]|nr:hypothetical protein [Planctomycetota bacterium]